MNLNPHVLKCRRRVYAVTADQQNSDVMNLLHMYGPIHTSVDSNFGERESDRLFGTRKNTSHWRKTDDVSRFDKVVEKAMVHAGKSTDSEPKTDEKRKSLASIINGIAPASPFDVQVKPKEPSINSQAVTTGETDD